MDESRWLIETDGRVLCYFAHMQTHFLSVEARNRKLALSCLRLYRRAGNTIPKECKQAILAAEQFIDRGNSDHAYAKAKHELEQTMSWTLDREYVEGMINLLDFIENISQSIQVKDLLFEHIPGAEIRDIFGNPFCQIDFNSKWRTSEAYGVALKMYDSNKYNAMPILADTLQDAGCEDAAILGHCRDANGVHVRGCWVVDLVLGKS